MASLRIPGTRAALLAALALLAIVAIGTVLAAAAHPLNQDANQGGTGTTDWKGEWTVGAGDDLTYANQTIRLDGNLSIGGGGKLTLRNARLILHGSPNALQEVKLLDGGELVVTDKDGNPTTPADKSTITTNTTGIHFYLKAYAGSKLTIRNSDVRNCGELFNDQGYLAGVYLGTGAATLENVDIGNGFGGVFIDGVAPTIKGCTVHDNDWVGIYVDNGAEPIIEDCRVEDNGREGIIVKDLSDLTLVRCVVTGNGRGVFVDGAYLTAEGCTLKDNNATADLNLPHNSHVELFNSTVSTNAMYKPVVMENSSLISTNGNFDNARVQMEASVFYYQQFLNVIVEWSDSATTPIAGASVTVQDAEGRVYEFVTDAEGRVPWVALQVVEYDKTSGMLKTYIYNPFTLTVTYKGNILTRTTEMRYAGATERFTYNDVEDPVAVPPSDITVDIGQNVTLDGSGSTDNVAIERWEWTFEERGLPSTFEGEQVECAFQEAKIYSVTLKVTDTSGRSGTRSSAPFTVTAVDRTPPVADAGISLVVSQGALVQFDGRNSTDNVAVVGYTWSFTYDSAVRSLTGSQAQWTFNLPGVYTVVLTVEDAKGLSDSVSITVTVADTTAPTTAAALDSTATPVGRLYPEVVQVLFTVTGEAAGDHTIHYRINGGTWKTFTGSLAFGDGLEYSDGTYTIDYYSSDGAGNIETTRSIEAFSVDATAPTFTEMDPAVSPYSTTEPSYVIRGRTEPGVTLTLNGQPLTVAADGRFLSNMTLAEGDNPFTLIARDAAGHQTDKSLVINYQKQTTDRDDAGPNWLVIGGIIVVGVILVVIVLLVMRRKK